MKTSYFKSGIILIASLFIIFGACKTKVKAQETTQVEASCKVVINLAAEEPV